MNTTTGELDKTGVAAYSYDGRAVTGVDDIAVDAEGGVLDADGVTEFYSPGGALILRAASPAEGLKVLPAGFYIARQGRVTEKVCVR